MRRLRCPACVSPGLRNTQKFATESLPPPKSTTRIDQQKANPARSFAGVVTATQCADDVLAIQEVVRQNDPSV
jgi:hypothetical protein